MITMGDRIIHYNQHRIMNYERCNTLPTLEELGIESDEEVDKHEEFENEMELVFYNEDNTYETVKVVHQLRASDLCQVLAMKNQKDKNCFWSVVEHWIDIGIERVVEDHEDIMEVFKEMESYRKPISKKFIFRREYDKYDMFMDPEKYFPAEMIDFSGFSGNSVEDITNPEVLKMLVKDSDECISMLDHVWLRDPFTLMWTKVYLLLKEKNLYLTYKMQTMFTFLSHWNTTGVQPRVIENNVYLRFGEEQSELSHPRLLGSFPESSVYSTVSGKELRTPTSFGLCIWSKQRSCEPACIGDFASDLHCIACESEKSRAAWISAMRLCKFGKCIRDNFKRFQGKKTERPYPPSREYSTRSTSGESMRTRVAVDFTGNVGRIIDDPIEAQAIAQKERYSVYRERPDLRRIPAHINPTAGLHETQPWYHGKLPRERAAHLLRMKGDDGAFLVRESTSHCGTFVLSFKYGGKVLHSQIFPALDSPQSHLCFSLDQVTKFYDLVQLIEYYQLNAGCLPTRLTHFLVCEKSRKKHEAQYFSCAHRQQSASLNSPHSTAAAKKSSSTNGKIRAAENASRSI